MRRHSAAISREASLTQTLSHHCHASRKLGSPRGAPTLSTLNHSPRPLTKMPFRATSPEAVSLGGGAPVTSTPPPPPPRPPRPSRGPANVTRIPIEDETANGTFSFVTKLGQMLEDSVSSRFVSWSLSGESIVVVDSASFAQQVLPRCCSAQPPIPLNHPAQKSAPLLIWIQNSSGIGNTTTIPHPQRARCVPCSLSAHAPASDAPQLSPASPHLPSARYLGG